MENEKDEITLQVQAKAEELLASVTSNIDRIDGLALITQFKNSEIDYSMLNSVVANSRQARLNLALAMVDFIESVFKQEDYLKHNGDVAIVDTLRTQINKAEYFDEFIDFSSQEHWFGIASELRSTLAQDRSFIKLFEECYEECKNGK